MKYPECERMLAVKDKSQAIGEFLEYMGNQGFVLCEFKAQNDPDSREFDESEPEWDGPSGHYPIRKNTEQLLAEFFGIDLNKIEKEKQAMLAELRGEKVA